MDLSVLFSKVGQSSRTHEDHVSKTLAKVKKVRYVIKSHPNGIYRVLKTRGKMDI
jgi:hypothetical protein